LAKVGVQFLRFVIKIKNNKKTQKQFETEEYKSNLYNEDDEEEKKKKNPHQPPTTKTTITTITTHTHTHTHTDTQIHTCIASIKNHMR
jgi:hypothetical protein